MMKQTEFDMAVVGAGPVGTAAAIHAALQGLNVAVFESYSQAKERPGESLPPGVEVIFRQLGVWDTIEKKPCIRNTGHFTRYKESEQTQFHPYGRDEKGEWQGIQLPRMMLDTILRERALELGVQLFAGCHIQTIQLKNESLQLVTQAKQPIAAKYYIDATGAGHLFARNLGIKMLRHSPTLMAQFGYLEKHCPYHELPVFIQSQTGWSWYAEVEPQRYAWVSVDKNAKQTSKPINLIKAGGADVTWRIAQQLAAPNFFLAGDAACVLDPSAGHGVLRALMTGIMAADYISNIIKNRISALDAYASYSFWLNEWFRQDVVQLKQRFAGRN